MKVILNNKLLSHLTGAPLSALEKRGTQQQTSPRNDEDIYLEGVIVPEDSFLSGLDGFVSPKQMRDKMDAISGDINLFIDSPGGSISAASNMLTHIIKLRKEGRKVNVVVSGIAASAATYFLFKADTTLIAPMAQVMIHSSWTCACGNAQDLNKVVNLLEKTDAQYTEQMVNLTGQDKATVEQAIADETWFTGEEAVEWGLIGGLYTDVEPSAELDPDLSNQFELLLSQWSDF